MNKKECKVEVSGNKVNLRRMKYSNSAYLTFCEKVTYDPEKKLSPLDSCQNHIRVAPAVRQKITGKYCTLVNTSNGNFIDVTVDSATPENMDYSIQITGFIERILGASAGDVLTICNQNSCELTKVKQQKLENIKSDRIVIPTGTVIETFLEEFSLFEIINPLTNDSIFVRSKYFTVDPALHEDEIRINKKQRKMLSDNIPPRITAKQWDQIMDDKKVSDEVKVALSEEYSKEGKSYTITKSVDDISYGSKLTLQKIVREKFGESLIVRPVIESFRYEKKRGILKTLCDVFVGKSTLSLNCRRPHECDENADIVRMTEENMLFLGIEPMDKIVIQYKEKSVSCHVLPFDLEKFKYTNIPSVMEFSIGIPAHVRNILGIVDIQSAVKVDRDTWFIFRKSFNEQLVPVLLAILSLNFLQDLKWYISAGLVAVLIPIVMYITLSTKRNMRGK